ncbi:MAG: hypothetical protein JST67_02745 [Bacteroidetes bacterium]|nr:hypothetical protein [Bacteroidota bacterium]
MSNHTRIQEAIDKAEANVNYLAALPDAVLSEKLNTVHLQMELAEQKRNTNSLELLEAWRSQIIEARIYKAENNIPDAPNEIELAIANIETIVAKTEKRQEIFTEPIKEKIHKPKIKKEDRDQMSLF